MYSLFVVLLVVVAYFGEMGAVCVREGKAESVWWDQ